MAVLFTLSLTSPYFFSLSFVYKSQPTLDCFSATKARTYTHTDSDLCCENLCALPDASSFLVFAPKPIASITNTPLSDRGVSLSNTHKKRFFSSFFWRNFIPYTILFLFHGVFLFKFWNLITACGKRILGSFDLTPFCSSDIFRILFLLVFQ